MRYINMDSIVLSNEWLANSQKATREVDQGADIDDFCKVWQDLKPELEKLVDKKCWYCEAIQSRSDKDVEHFRPKKKVCNVKPDHDGYRWLAFNYKNYRYSCGYCNKRRKDSGNNNRLGGKGNYFPLIDENKRAYKPGDEVYERPKLLDPCREVDVKLLDFNDDGTPCPVTSANEIDRDRVEESIKLYHLHHSEIVEDRKKLAHILEHFISDAEYDFQKLAMGDNEAINRFEKKLKFLKDAINIKAQFSLFAERYIAGKRNLEWIELVLE